MRKLIALSLLVLAFGSFAFADDAKVMPMMVGRVYLAPTYSFALGGYDKNGTYRSFDGYAVDDEERLPSSYNSVRDGSVKVFNLGFALEYGIIHWLTLAFQWAPGWTIWSDIDAVTGRENTNSNGVADLFVGLKVQILGEKAPVATSKFRFAVAPGAVVPFPGPDFEDEVANLSRGEAATFASMDKHVFSTGARFYFDWLINDRFFINFYNETLFYPVKQDLNKDGPNLAALKGRILQTVAAAQGAPGVAAVKPLVDQVEGEVNYKYKLTFEIEPSYTMPIASGVSMTFGLPINYIFVPAYEYSVDGLAVLAQAIGQSEEALLQQGGLVGKDSHTLSLKPNVSMFLTKTPMPLEFKLQYLAPVWGQNVSAARHNLTLQIKVYFALPGRPQ